MTNNADVTIFNQRISAERREVFIPTVISGVCWYDVRSMRQSERNRTGESEFIIRIPFDAKVQDGRSYIPESQYQKLSDDEVKKYWTIQLNSYVLKQQYVDAAAWEFDTYSFRAGVISELSIEDIDTLRAEQEDFVTVVEYADNTVRGTDLTKHWRIGGA